jgi:outer membrane biosynthesis protein TonB
MTETEIWTKWESQVVNGVFPLRRFLGRSNHSVVFLTECRAQNLANAAIKIIPADAARAESRLSRWQLAAALSHPHLIRLLEAGRCKLGGHPFLFVVTEYAEQNLAQILPHRALTISELREMLTPTLDVLAYLHRQNLVHGQLKASNFLVVNDQLKLASDTIRAAADTTGIDLAGDVRALGATIVEALTQTRPALNAPAAALPLPATLSPGLADALRRSLSPESGNRPTISDLRKLVGPEAEAPTPPASEPQIAIPLPMPASEVSAQPPAVPPPEAIHAPGPPAAHRRPASTRAPYERWLVPVVAVGLVLLAVWGGSRMLRSHADPRPRPNAVPTASQQTPSPAAAQSAATTPSQATPVVHEELPTISRSARDSIHGQIKVTVRVTVDRAGNVVAENLEAHGSSRYFSRLATDAAKKWKFAPADNPSPREWSVQFEFSRSGATGLAVPRVR